MAKETYDNDTNKFAEAQGDEQFIYELPDKALLDVKPSSEFSPYLAKDGVDYVVVQQPSTIQEIRGRLDIQPIHYFPPAGGNYFYVDGHTSPLNLRDLITARVARGWEITPILDALMRNQLIDATFLPDRDLQT